MRKEALLKLKAEREILKKENEDWRFEMAYYTTEDTPTPKGVNKFVKSIMDKTTKALKRPTEGEIEKQIERAMRFAYREGREQKIIHATWYKDWAKHYAEAISAIIPPRPKISVEEIAKTVFLHDTWLDGVENKEACWKLIIDAKRHSGDCTNEAHSCQMCIKEDYFKTAKAISKRMEG